MNKKEIVKINNKLISNGWNLIPLEYKEIYSEMGTQLTR